MILTWFSSRRIAKDLSLQPIALDLDKWITTAIENRPELVGFEALLEQSLLNIRVANNTLFPQVDLVGTYERLLSGSTFEKSTDRDTEVWSAGLTFSVPIGNVAAKSDLIRAKREHTLLQHRRDREVPHGFPPPTPPGIGVPTMAVRYG